MSKSLLITHAADCLIKFRSSKFPLKNVALELIRNKRLNKKQRVALLDLLFSWAREINLIKEYISHKIQFSSGLSTQQKDLYALNLLNNEQSFFEYQEWCKLLGKEKFLLALNGCVAKILKADYCDDVYDIAQGLLEKPIKYLAFDRSKISSQEVFNALTSLGVTCFRHENLDSAIGVLENINLKELPKEIADSLWFMDVGSQIIASLIIPQKNQKVLDMCAGEGNKARYITSLACDYTALDVDKSRLKKASSRLKGVNFIVEDACSSSLEEESFDWILLDAPCSGSGTIKRYPDLIHRITYDQVRRYSSLQRKLLLSAKKLLKPGGKIIYATCSLFKQENEQQIKKILGEDTSLLAADLKYLLQKSNVKIDPNDINGCSVNLFPHKNKCDGFFVAVIKKKS